MTLTCESGTLSTRELRFLAFLGWVLLTVGTLGTYATASEWREHGAARDTMQLMAATMITVIISVWLGFLVRKHRRAAAGTTAAAR
ncbi:MAG: hypothetical protein ACK51N_03770 [bacterium]|jgi:hypothetical protein